MGERHWLMLGASGYTASFMLPAAELVLAREARESGEAASVARRSPTPGHRACEGASGRCDAGCDRLSGRRIDRLIRKLSDSRG